MQNQFKDASDPTKREGIQAQITACRDQLAKMRQDRDWRVVREWFRKELEGDEKGAIRPVLPFYIHYPKSILEAMLYRGVWLPVESKAKASRVTVENYDKAFEESKLPLLKLAYSNDGKFSVEYTRRQTAMLVPERGFDAKGLKSAIEKLLETGPSETTWQNFCGNEGLAEFFPAKNTEKNVVVYRLAEKRTKREKLLDLGMSNEEIPDFDAEHFEMQVSRLVIPPERPKRGSKQKTSLPEPTHLAENTELQQILRRLRPQIEEYFRQKPPYLGERPRKESERKEWEAKNVRAKESWDAFLKETGLDRYKRIYLRTDEPDVTATPFEKAGLRKVLLFPAKRFDRAKAENQAKSISDTWTRFQLREFLKWNPAQQEWKDFCGTFVQVTREQFREFLAKEPKQASEFVEFYRVASARTEATHICYVQQIIGDPDEYVNVSKDGTGIYAKGGNAGYLIYKRMVKDEDGKDTITFGASPVRCFENPKDAKQKLLSNAGIVLCDPKPWRTNMLLQLPQDMPNGKQIIPKGYYYFGSVSNARSATLKPFKGGDNFAGINVSALLAAGLKHVEINAI